MFRESKAFAGFSTSDIAKAREFYGTTLGVDVSEENGMLTLRLAGGGTVLIYPKPNHEAATFTVLNFPVRNIEESVDRLTRAGIVFERYPGMKQDGRGIMQEEPRIAWFKDPAGNVLSVIQA